MVKYSSIIERKEVYTKVVVSDKYGFDINGTALIFGMITPGGSSASRGIILKNDYGKKVYIEIYVMGDIKI